MKTHRDYEYFLFPVTDDYDGTIDVEALWYMIDMKASEGWRLHSIFLHQDIKPMRPMEIEPFKMDDGTPVKQTLLIFERRVKPEE